MFLLHHFTSLLFSPAHFSSFSCSFSSSSSPFGRGESITGRIESNLGERRTVDPKEVTRRILLRLFDYVRMPLCVCPYVCLWIYIYTCVRICLWIRAWVLTRTSAPPPSKKGGEGHHNPRVFALCVVFSGPAWPPAPQMTPDSTNRTSRDAVK